MHIHKRGTNMVHEQITYPLGPLTTDQIKALGEKEESLKASVKVDIMEFVNEDPDAYEVFLDHVAEKTGAPLLMDISHDIVGIDTENPTLVIFNIEGDVSEEYNRILEEEEYKETKGE
jgi:hypothetical protein